MSGPSQNPFKRIIGEIHRRSLWQVLAIYVVSGWVVYEVVQSLTEGLGLPGWFPAFAFVLLLIGLPIVLATAFVQEGGPRTPSGDTRADLDQIFSEREASEEPQSVGVRHLFTWRNAILGGMAAFALWGVVAAGWIVIGPGAEAIRFGGAQAAADRASIAVLPFDNLSPDPDNAFFADGIHDEILSQLAKISALKVISRTSVMGYRETSKNLRTIAGELNVNHVLEGSVRRAGDQVRITTQLIDATSDEHLWSETYERRLSDIFAIQADVARGVAAELRAQLSPREEERIAARPTGDPQAYDLFLRAREHNRSWANCEEGFQAVEHYERAVGRDPAFAVAFAYLSRAHSRSYWYGCDRDRERTLAARTAADSALALDPDLPEAHLSLAYYHYFGFRDYERALAEARIAASGLANDPAVHSLTAGVKRRQGRFAEAARDYERAFELNPRSASAAYQVATTYGPMGRYEEAIRWCERAWDLPPEHQWGLNFRVRTLIALHGDADEGSQVLRDAARTIDTTRVDYLQSAYDIALVDDDYESAIAYAERFPDRLVGQFSISKLIHLARAHRLAGHPQRAMALYDSARTVLEGAAREAVESQDPFAATVQSQLAMAYAGLGRAEEAVRAGRRAVELLPVSVDALVGPHRVLYLALVHTLLGQEEEALDQLERYLGYWPPQSLRRYPEFDPLRDHPRFQALLERYGNVEYDTVPVGR